MTNRKDLKANLENLQQTRKRLTIGVRSKMTEYKKMVRFGFLQVKE